MESSCFRRAPPAMCSIWDTPSPANIFKSFRFSKIKSKFREDAGIMESPVAKKGKTIQGKGRARQLQRTPWKLELQLRSFFISSHKRVLRDLLAQNAEKNSSLCWQSIWLPDHKSLVWSSNTASQSATSKQKKNVCLPHGDCSEGPPDVTGSHFWLTPATSPVTFRRCFEAGEGPHPAPWEPSVSEHFLDAPESLSHEPEVASGLVQ